MKSSLMKLSCMFSSLQTGQLCNPHVGAHRSARQRRQGQGPACTPFGQKLCPLGGGNGEEDKIGAPSWNPQNTPSPLVLPSPDFAAEEAVTAQLEALQRCDEPWPGHGIQLAYEWALDVGGLDPSWYFGYRKDLYHEDHFRGQFSNQLPELINAQGYVVEEVKQSSGDDAAAGRWVVRVRVTDRTGSKEQSFEFHLERKRVGRSKGSLMTAMIKRV